MSKDIDDIIDEFICPTVMDFDVVIKWANILEIEVNPPPVDDMYPDWENELRVEVGDAIRKVFDKRIKVSRPIGKEKKF